mmetsp:Transcript_14304/g.47794  ORF Transcript_14304/g.47794 Transcript_14304/m.47794 type:complete len:294 (-) Transcript_14304:1016-1897(-)
MSTPKPRSVGAVWSGLNALGSRDRATSSRRRATERGDATATENAGVRAANASTARYVARARFPRPKPARWSRHTSSSASTIRTCVSPPTASRGRLSAVKSCHAETFASALPSETPSTKEGAPRRTEATLAPEKETKTTLVASNASTFCVNDSKTTPASMSSANASTCGPSMVARAAPGLCAASPRSSLPAASETAAKARARNESACVFSVEYVARASAYAPLSASATVVEYGARVAAARGAWIDSPGGTTRTPSETSSRPRPPRAARTAASSDCSRHAERLTRSWSIGSSKSA